MAQLKVLGTSPTGYQMPTSAAHEYISMESLPDDLKLRFFMENFDRISMERLEKLILPERPEKTLDDFTDGEIMDEAKKRSGDDYRTIDGFTDSDLKDELRYRKFVVLKPANLHQEIYLESVTEILPTL